MKKLMALIALMTLAVPSVAHADISQERFEEIFTIARAHCPIAMKSTNAGKYISELSGTMYLVPEEKILLLNYCLMFIDGQIAG